MVIYADILFITNLYIDFFLLVCVKNFLHLRVSVWRLLAGGLAGAGSSMTALLPDGMPTGLSVFLGIVAAFLVTAAAFAPVKGMMYLKIAVCYWFASFLFAGFFLLLYHLFSPRNLAVVSGIVYLHISPVMLFGLTVIAYIVLTLLQKILGPKESDLRFCRIHIENENNETIIFAKADTGNALCEPFSGLPVIIAEKKALGKTIPPAVSAFLAGDLPDSMIRLIPFESMGGSGVLPAFQAKKIFFEHEQTNPLHCYIAVYTGNLSSGQFQALFNPDLLTNTYSTTPSQNRRIATPPKL